MIGRAVLQCLAAINPGRTLRIRLKRYSDHAERIMEEFAGYDNLAFETADDMESLVRDADGGVVHNFGQKACLWRIYPCSGQACSWCRSIPVASRTATACSIA